MRDLAWIKRDNEQAVEDYYYSLQHEGRETENPKSSAKGKETIWFIILEEEGQTLPEFLKDWLD